MNKRIVRKRNVPNGILNGIRIVFQMASRLASLITSQKTSRKASPNGVPNGWSPNGLPNSVPNASSNVVPNLTFYFRQRGHCPMSSYYYALKEQKLLFIDKEHSEWIAFIKKTNPGNSTDMKAESMFLGIVAIIKREEIKTKHRHRIHK